MGGQSDDTTNGVERRNVLKGAAAIGIGAAAWAVPDITSMGGTPAYAASCTAGSSVFSICETNTSCSCVGNAGTAYAGVDVIDYKPCKNTACPGPAFDGSASINVPQSGACPSGSTPNGNQATGATVSVNPNNSSLFCKAIVRVYDGAQCSSNYTQFEGPVPNSPGSASLTLPVIPCASTGGGGNKFVAVFVECSTERECLF